MVDEGCKAVVMEVSSQGLKLDRTAGIVFDIGRGAYDHHQKDSRVRENGIPYAAFGLLWEELGTEILGEELADVLFVVLCLANQTGINLQESFDKKLDRRIQISAERTLFSSPAFKQVSFSELMRSARILICF